MELKDCVNMESCCDFIWDFLFNHESYVIEELQGYLSDIGIKSLTPSLFYKVENWTSCQIVTQKMIDEESIDSDVYDVYVGDFLYTWEKEKIIEGLKKEELLKVQFFCYFLDNPHIWIGSYY
jgi:hypothetical protein